MSEGKKKSGGPWFAIVVVVLLAGVAVEGTVFLKAKHEMQRPKAAQLAIHDDPVTYIGKKGAPITLEFYAPLTLAWHEKTIGLLRDYDKKHPGQIFVTLMPMGNPECDKIIQDRGGHCAVIDVNGKHQFTLPSGKKADLELKPNKGGNGLYNSEDVITVVEMLSAGKK
jgi:hypothetical protein